MPDPLPKFEASLSKYFRVEDHFALVASITNDTPEAELREAFDINLYVTAKARYLTVKDGVVYRDKLVDLIRDEGGFTERREDGYVFSLHVSRPAIPRIHLQHPRGEELEMGHVNILRHSLGVLRASRRQKSLYEPSTVLEPDRNNRRGLVESPHA
jgi:hypothetical protein